MCIVMCIVLFFDIKFYFKISVMSLFVGSYYRTSIHAASRDIHQISKRTLCNICAIPARNESICMAGCVR